ncbi:hypothetical protein Misp01_72390 [Microtetraspora sp. NBRC 13810]|nr:hypothetical protein Misp01_72390 [Microtetraspora sp. NBRC 13810]
MGRHLGLAAIASAAAVLLSSGAAQAQARALPAALTAPAPATAVSALPASAASVSVASVSVASGAGVRRAPEAPPFAAPDRTLRTGASGTAVKRLQARLKELGYHPGSVDGRYGGATLAAVWAFQKVNGVKPTGTVSGRTWRALEEPRAPRVLVPKGRPDRVEVDLTKQIMVLYSAGEARLISHISSGSGVPYCETATWEGRTQRFCGDARTPTGNYKTTWRRDGWHVSYLGRLYNPIFFNGGIAFHGALSVPLAPASHGCVRLPMHIAEMLPDLLGTGVPVHVRGKFAR